MRVDCIVEVIAAFVILLSTCGVRAAQAVQIGSFKSRAIWTPTESGQRKTVIILVPGSGVSGPRENIPGRYTVDGNDAHLFDQFAAAFQRGGVQTLQLGKPGVEDQLNFDPVHLFYDQSLYSNLHWSDLLLNVQNAVDFLRSQSSVDPEKIFILGHSEGTQVAADFASTHKNIAGVILLGFAGEDVATRVDWELFRRPIDNFVATDVDLNHDGQVSRSEAALTPDFHWDWKPGMSSVSYEEVEASYRIDPSLQVAMQTIKSSPLFADGIWNRGPIYTEVARLTQPVYIFNGDLDQETPLRESLNLKNACEAQGKSDCTLTVISRVGHGFSVPRPPRSQQFLDMTVGPAGIEILNKLTDLATALR